MSLINIKQRLIDYKKPDTRFGPALEEGELLETYVKALVGKNWSDKLPIDHPSGYDFLDHKYGCFLDIKASKHTQYNGDCFVEYIQNWGHNSNKKANHYSGTLEDGVGYFLLYVDTTKQGFGSTTLFNVRKLRELYSDESKLIKGGWDARGFKVPSSDTRVARTLQLPEAQQ